MRPIARPSKIFSSGDIIRIAYPYVERDRAAVRPALVLTVRPVGLQSSLIWAMMITSAENRGWPGDISLEEDHLAFGLPRPCVLRTAKTAALQFDNATLLGKLSREKLDEVRTLLRDMLGL